ncbi:heat shock factor binding protein 1-domain-containing protein [Lyophyllum atratum]|nr:heat shock factor binding protein 1-domain-containing protein [Lyophyllum atratum]
MPSSALPLNVDRTPTPSFKQPSASKPSALAPADISSPHELTAFVESLLEQLDTKFDEMSSQILDRMSQMSTRVDALEASIQDIINGDMSVPQSPSPNSATPAIRRSDNAL